MIEVDINKLNDLIESYEELIKQIDKNNEDIVAEFYNIKKYWHDQKCINMYSSFELEKKRIIKNAENIKKQENIYKYIKQQYKVFGEKIKINLGKYDKIIEKINLVKSDIKWLIERYHNLDKDFYPRDYVLNNQCAKLERMKDSLDNIKEKIKNDYNKMNNIESNIQEMISNNRIENFSFNNYESEV